MMEICQFHSIYLQKEAKSNQKQPCCKKACVHCCEKDVESNKIAAKKWMAVMEANGKNFNNNNLGEFGA